MAVMFVRDDALWYTHVDEKRAIIVKIRRAVIVDLASMEQIYARARKFYDCYGKS